LEEIASDNWQLECSQMEWRRNPAGSASPRERVRRRYQPVLTGSGSDICGLYQGGPSSEAGFASVPVRMQTFPHPHHPRNADPAAPRIVMMTRVLAFVIAMGVAQGTAWGQLPVAPERTQFEKSNLPLESSAPPLLTEPSSTLSTPSLPCSQMTTIPASSLLNSGGFPDAPSAYRPLSPHCRFEIFVRQTYSPYTFASATFDATWAQMFAQWPQYGGGMQGWSKRLGATLADVESRRFIQTFALASLLHEDPRYYPSEAHGLISRAWYAATRVLVTRDDYGRDVFNQSEFLGASMVSSLQDAYYPRPDRTFSATVNRFVGTLSSDATTNILHEFTPDLKRMFHKHCPESIQRFEARMPLPENVKP
jgi:hypothetical protein